MTNPLEPLGHAAVDKPGVLHVSSVLPTLNQMIDAYNTAIQHIQALEAEVEKLKRRHSHHYVENDDHVTGWQDYEETTTNE